ncbi:MAG TPA: hypothetical protein VFQ27_00800 [Xanthobacteraceae bacterium]|nr:hypothetical protein [Xanthobacteraceae bacterium]
MNVVAFPKPVGALAGDWRPDELRQLIDALSAHARANGATVYWDVGTTECGDPQFYLLGPPPHFECLLCCSRVEARYILEDGAGGVLAEETTLGEAIARAFRALRPSRGAVLSRMFLLLAAFRITVEQKLEPMLAESTDWLTRFAPQLAALA